MTRWLWVLAAAGCAGDTPSPTASPPTGDTAAACAASVELGTGVTDFAPIGDTLTVVHGPQGGWHATAAARWCGLAAPVTASATAYWDAEAITVGQSPVYDKLPVPLDRDGCCFEMLDLTTYLLLPDGSLAGPALHNQSVTLTLTVVDGLGGAHTAAVTTTLLDPEAGG